MIPRVAPACMPGAVEDPLEPDVVVLENADVERPLVLVVVVVVVPPVRAPVVDDPVLRPAVDVPGGKPGTFDVVGNPDSGVTRTKSSSVMGSLNFLRSKRSVTSASTLGGDAPPYLRW